MNDLENMKNSIIYSDKVYEPESVFAGWLSLSYILLTTSLLFYHMSQIKSLKSSRSIAAAISIALVVISCLYMIYSIGPYSERINHVINICKKDSLCNKEDLSKLVIVKKCYVGLCIMTSIIQIYIVWLIYKNANKH